MDCILQWYYYALVHNVYMRHCVICSTEARCPLREQNHRQQINHPVTLHLHCINVELGSIMAIGRT